jgi:hypothetical protein
MKTKSQRRQRLMAMKNTMNPVVSKTVCSRSTPTKTSIVQTMRKICLDPNDTQAVSRTVSKRDKKIIQGLGKSSKEIIQRLEKWSTESYGTDAGREFAYSRQNADDQEPRFGQACNDNCDEYNETQRYSANLRNAAEQPAPYVEPVSEFRDADNSQTIASYCGDEDAGASMTQRYQSKLYVEEPYHDSGYQSRALGNEVSDEQSYDYDERNRLVTSSPNPTGKAPIGNVSSPRGIGIGRITSTGPMTRRCMNLGVKFG